MRIRSKDGSPNIMSGPYAGLGTIDGKWKEVQPKLEAIARQLVGLCPSSYDTDPPMAKVHAAPPPAKPQVFGHGSSSEE
jgi:hypothetical protein